MKGMLLETMQGFTQAGYTVCASRMQVEKVEGEVVMGLVCGL